jgi:hypothetical protein
MKSGVLVHTRSIETPIDLLIRRVA